MTVNFTDLDLKEFVAKSLGDTGLAYGTFSLALIGHKVKEVLREFSRYVPYKVRHSVLTKAETREVDISAIDNLLHVDYAEYRVNQIDREFRNVIYRRHGFITIDVEWTPAADETVYLYCRKLQTAEVLEEAHLELFTRLCAARVMIAQPVAKPHINAINKGGRRVVSEYRILGQDQLREVIFELEGLEPPNMKKYHSAGRPVVISESYIQVD